MFSYGFMPSAIPATYIKNGFPKLDHEYLKRVLLVAFQALSENERLKNLILFSIKCYYYELTG